MCQEGPGDSGVCAGRGCGRIIKETDPQERGPAGLEEGLGVGPRRAERNQEERLGRQTCLLHKPCMPVGTVGSIKGVHRTGKCGSEFKAGWPGGWLSEGREDGRGVAWCEGWSGAGRRADGFGFGCLVISRDCGASG